MPGEREREREPHAWRRFISMAAGLDLYVAWLVAPRDSSQDRDPQMAAPRFGALAGGGLCHGRGALRALDEQRDHGRSLRARFRSDRDRDRGRC